MSRIEDLPVLIYTMGRVSSGSTSIALMKAGFDNRFHVHTMNEDWREWTNSPNPQRGMTKQQEERYHFDRKVRADIIDTGKEALIISLVREPLTRNMSAFFMNQVDKKKVTDTDPDDLVRKFKKRYAHYVPLQWYQREFNTVLDVDVFANPFDKKLGYQLLERGPYKILLLRTELTNEAKGEALSEFLGRPIEMEVARKKSQYELSDEALDTYREFKKHAKVRPEFLDWIYSSKYARHFMSKREMREMRERWESPNAPDQPWRTQP